MVRSAAYGLAITLGVMATPGAGSSASAQEASVHTVQTDNPANPERVAPAARVLDRTVTLRLERVPLGTALATLADSARLTMSYSRTRVPLDKVVSLVADRITVKDALSVLLLETGLEVDVARTGRVRIWPVGAEATTHTRTTQATGTIAGRVTDAKTGVGIRYATVLLSDTRYAATTGDSGTFHLTAVPPGAYIVTVRALGYVAARRGVTLEAGQTAKADVALEKSAQRLDEVVTTGTMVPTEVKALPTPISVVTAEDIQQQNLQRVDQVFRGMVPGAIAWDQGPNNEISLIMVRGTSTITQVPTIKTFIDGVEVADPEYVALVDPNSIERVEITRGPQASTLYGAGALSGVMQLFTKKGDFGLTRPQVSGKVSFGGVAGLDGGSAASQTDNTLSVLGGGEKTSYNLGGSYRHVGEFTPSYHATNWGLSAGGQTAQGPLTLSGSARYGEQDRDAPWKTWFKSYTDFSRPPNEADGFRQQTYGATASLRATPAWQHAVTLGYDQLYYTLTTTRPRFTTPADSFVGFATLHNSKLSVLYHTDVTMQLGTAGAAVITAGANHEASDLVSSFTGGATRTTGFLNGSTFEQHIPSTNTGYFGQVQVNLVERLFLTGGLRAERNDNFGATFGTAWSPRIGGAYALELGPATVKLRASYGESIRAPANGERDAFVQSFQTQIANPNLAPERQRGIDGGVDAFMGRASVGVTYYNQQAIDLIQAIVLSGPNLLVPTSQNQNVSRVRNNGWEFEGRAPFGPVAIGGTYSITNSRIEALFPNYPSGGYQVGDRLLGIPTSSAGATVTYTPVSRTTLTASMTYIGHWIEHDWRAEYGFFFGGQAYRGTDRAYWMEYPSVTKLGVGLSQTLTSQVTAFTRLENVGNNLRFEANNITFRMPRSVIVGANVRY